MISALTIFICFALLSRQYALWMPMYADYLFWQVEILAVCLIGVLGEATQRDRSILTLLALYSAWVVITDQFTFELSPIVLQYETVIVVLMLFWALVRPYTTPSQERDPSKVAIAFYHGNNAPLLSSLSALIGLPFASIAVLAGNTALRPDKCGKLILSEASAYDHNKNYTIINTGFSASPKFFELVASCVGNKTRIGFFRAGCVRSMTPILEHIGLKPKSILHFIPSLFYYQVAGYAYARKYAIKS